MRDCHIQLVFPSSALQTLPERPIPLRSHHKEGLRRRRRRRRRKGGERGGGGVYLESYRREARGGGRRTDVRAECTVAGAKRPTVGWRRMVDDTAKAHGRSTGTAGISRTDERDVFHSILQQDMPDDEDYHSDIRHPIALDWFRITKTSYTVRPRQR